MVPTNQEFSDHSPSLDKTTSKSKPATFICSYENCSKAFKAKKSLIDHTRIHKGEKPYSCHFSPCDKAFTQYSSLQKHERIHKGEKPYNCETCGQSFTQVSNLKRHERSHRGERPHSCEICSKGFTTSSNLKQHLQTHLQKDTREKYECQTCGKSYNYNSSLKKHLQEHGVDISKKEPNDGLERNPFEIDQFKSFDKMQFPLNLANLSSMGEPIQIQSEKGWNQFYNFPLPSFPQNDLEIFQGFQTNLLFNGLLQNTFLGRGTQQPEATSLNMKRPAHSHLDIGGAQERIEKYEPKNVKRPYKGGHHHHHHMHSLTCEHLMVIHQGHVDYLHDGKLHHINDNGCIEEHELEISDINPVKCKQLKEKHSCSMKKPINPVIPVFSANIPDKNKSSIPPASQITQITQENPSLNFIVKSNSEEVQSGGQQVDAGAASKQAGEDCHACLGHPKGEESSPLKEDFCSLINHVHNETCEHPMILHNGHIDYIVEGQLHHVHNDHCDNHGSIFIVDKFSEIQKAYQTGMMDNAIQGY